MPWVFDALIFINKDVASDNEDTAHKIRGWMKLGTALGYVLILKCWTYKWKIYVQLLGRNNLELQLNQTRWIGQRH